ncbi:MAG: cyclomaltodextrinase N-terminal domain-containing protein, partial [Pyrinomonadaceae bacterium]|nr:cyclomaltodextrinase N-terminal domain-containing protein [Pyrinomonadaceae bacterium]
MKSFNKTFILIFVAAICVSGVFAQNVPIISKVEPPDWWANHSINPVRLLIRGENLGGAKVSSIDKNLKTSNLKFNSRGDYLFLDVSIEKNAKIGKYPLEIFNEKGKTSFEFEIKQPLDVQKNFQGITNDDVVYLIMPDRFSDGDSSNNKDVDRKNPRAWHGGDLRGVINHLDYLQELGVTAIWLTPWYENSDSINNCDKPWCPNTSYHGYGATDYYAVENHFGTIRDLRELVEKAHAKNIKVIQDQVANHVGKAHVWSKSPPLENWFNKFEQNTFNNSVLLSPNSSDAERNNLINAWFDEGLPDLNQNEPEVSKYLIQNALWWIGETGIDGIRQDTIQYMPRTFIRDWSFAINKQYPKFYMVGEVFERDSVQT